MNLGYTNDVLDAIETTFLRSAMADVVVEEIQELKQGKMPQPAPVFRLMSMASSEESPKRETTSPSPAAAAAAEAAEAGAGAAAALPELERNSLACGGCGGDDSEGAGGQGKKKTHRKNVRFSSVEISAIWNACSAEEYNRRSIVVDLSKTPFALFRRDAVMMKQARTLPGSAPLPPPAPPALPPQAVSPPGSSSDDHGNKESSPSSSPPPSSLMMRRRSGRLWDTESSESSEGHTTDLETDDTETDWHSDDAESVYSCSSEGSACPLVDQQLRRGSNSESGPAFYGVWKRTSSEGYEELLLKSGVPKRAVAGAMKKHPVHIIDHDGSYFRLIVKNGLSKVDNTFWIGEEPKQVCVRIYYWLYY